MSILFSHFSSKNNEISPDKSKFTEVLCSIALVPKTLYFYGKLPENRPKTLAIVGTRKPTAYGHKIAYELAYAAAQRGAVVVSGLAFGIDSIAHRAALDAGGATVAVLGTPINDIYPRAHRALAEEIVAQGGAILSELAPDTPFHWQTCFLERNRLISGLADVVVIPEAAARSGSLNTAAHALEQGREVFAAPGDITRLTSVGCNRLITQGATPYTAVSDVLDLLFPHAQKSTPATISGDSPAETSILQLLASGLQGGDDLLKHTALPVSTFSQTLTLLEIKGCIKALGCNQWALR